MFARLCRCFGRVDVDREESRVKQTKPKEACRQTSSPENVLNKVQANEEEERLNRELELTTKERNELTDRLLYVTGGSMSKRYALLQTNDLVLNLISHREEIQNLTLTEE
ncbi:uncharacterized protein LOC134483374 isoform X2 [Rattus norvegicus]|uniref:uncharacterized protein LOC134483374 isoform X2 n=1 Tax=Rattus norvegicus TaxID=10116 RepID=UPI002FD8611E